MKNSRKLVRLVHNPTAGEGQYSKEEIVSLIESRGYECDYSSSKEKKALKDIQDETDFFIIAGGDGTVRKIVLKLLNKRLKDKRPIALLPFGTANNIAATLQLADSAEKNIDSWVHYHLKRFDVGQILGLKEPAFFFESFGFGLFPRLMKELKKIDTSGVKTAEDEFELALNTMHKLADNYQAVASTIKIGEKVFEGDFLLIEVMNISSLGPNLKLSEKADPGDGFFDVVMVAADQRALLCEYLSSKCVGKSVVFPFKSFQTKCLSISWEGKDVHIDDEVIRKYKGNAVDINILDSLLEFMTNIKL
jgi:diacylglycerol kinase family enzyme